MKAPRHTSQVSSKTQRSSKRFRESTHLIPTPGVEAPLPERHDTWPLSTWKVLSLALLMILIGIAIEVALRHSQINNGFKVAQRNIFGNIQPAFLTSFFPTLFVFPLRLFWEVADRTLARYQPYVALSRGGVRAEESLTLDYLSANTIVSLYKTAKRREWIIHVSMLTAIAVTFYQPLAGSVLYLKSVPTTQPATVTMTSDLGLSPDVKTLNAFLAAAGFTEAAAFQGLGDPPFIRQNWAVAQFKLPDNPGLNASILVNTTGVRTNINCEQSTSLNLNTSTPPYYNITAQGADGCSATVQFNISASSLDEQQYGSAPANAQNCGLPADTDIDFLPLMFWFYNTDAQNIPQAAAVICRPQIQLFNVMANVNLNNGSLVDVTILNNYTAPNNVSGDPLDGKVYNAVLFNTSATDPFVTARATAISAQIPGAIFRLASQDANFVQFFDNGSTGFLNLTKEIYTQHLAVSAKTVYFVTADETKSAQETSQIDRLLMDTFASQALALLLIGIGLVGIVTHLLHRRQRRNLYLTSAPGTIATIIALSSHSGFGELLYPYDNKKAIREKFANLRFSLDRRTGAIVADEYEYDEGVDADRSGRTSDAGMDDEEKMEMHRMDTLSSLTGEGKNRVGEKQVEGVEPKRQVDPLAFPYEHEPLILPPSRSPSRSPAARSASP